MGHVSRTGWRIGELAEKLGMNPKTIRYYEGIGLLPNPRRTPSGYRQYESTDLERLLFIGKAKAIGLTLDEIRDVLALREEGQRPCERVQGLIDQKVELVVRQLRALEEFHQELLALREEASQMSTEDAPVCRIIEHHVPIHAGAPGAGRRAGLARRPHSR